MNHSQMTLDEIAHIAVNKGANVTYDISCQGRHDYEDIITLISPDAVINDQADRYGIVSTIILTNSDAVVIRVSYYRGFTSHNMVEVETTTGAHNSNFDPAFLTPVRGIAGKGVVIEEEPITLRLVKEAINND